MSLSKFYSCEAMLWSPWIAYKGLRFLRGSCSSALLLHSTQGFLQAFESIYVSLNFFASVVDDSSRTCGWCFRV
jgi:hypothetical protein